MKRDGSVAAIAVVVGVVRRIGRLGVDLAGVRVHHDRGHALRLVGDPGGEQLLLDRELEAGVDRQAEVRAGRSGLQDRRGVGHGVPRCVVLQRDQARHPRQLGVVVLLDAVLPDALAVDEAEQMRGERRLGSAAGLRIQALLLGLQDEAGELRVVAGMELPDPIGRGRVETACEDHVLAVAGHARRQVRRRIALEPEQRHELPGDLRAALRREQLRVGREPVALDAGREDHRPGAVVDRAAGRRDRVRLRRLLDRHRGELVAPDHLPVRETRHESPRDHHEDDQEEDRADA